MKWQSAAGIRPSWLISVELPLGYGSCQEDMTGGEAALLHSLFVPQEEKGRQPHGCLYLDNNTEHMLGILLLA